MPSAPRIAARPPTPQDHTALLRKLALLFPDCTPAVELAQGRLVFRLVDGAGLARSNPVTFNRIHAASFTESALKQAIRLAGNPEGGLPRGL